MKSPDEGSKGRPNRVGRPRRQVASAHDLILDTVQSLLQTTSVRHLTMEGVAKAAGVGKPTLYKWWPTKSALVLAMVDERLVKLPTAPKSVSAQGAIRERVGRMISEFRGPFGRVMAELIAEGQSEPEVLRELYDRHIRIRRDHTISDIENAKADGEIRTDANTDLLIDAIFGALYYHLLLGIKPIDEAWGEQLVEQVLVGVRTQPSG